MIWRQSLAQPAFPAKHQTGQDFRSTLCVGLRSGSGLLEAWTRSAQKKCKQAKPRRRHARTLWTWRHRTRRPSQRISRDSQH
eukprot:9312677-Pyramimonas_sp.AAC.1